MQWKVYTHYSTSRSHADNLKVLIIVTTLRQSVTYDFCNQPNIPTFYAIVCERTLRRCPNGFHGTNTYSTAWLHRIVLRKYVREHGVLFANAKCLICLAICSIRYHCCEHTLQEMSVMSTDLETRIIRSC